MGRLDLLTANDRLGEYPPSWYAATAMPAPHRRPLAGVATADVCVIGGGYTGLSAALHLAEAGFSVILLEAGRIGNGASGRNGGQVGSGQRRNQTWLEAHYGPETARRLWDLAEEAKALVRTRIARHAIPCDPRPGIVYAARRAAEVPHYVEEAEKLAADYGYADIAPLDRAAMAEHVGSAALHGGYVDRGAFHIHPLNFALGLAAAAEAAGARLCESSRVTSVRPDGLAPCVRTDAGEVRARYVIVAGNGYIGDLMPEVGARAMPINNFIVATAPLGDARAKALLPQDEAVANSLFVVNYWRRSADNRLLFGGGESYGYRFPRDIAAVVRPRMLAIYPELASTAIDYAWGGTLAITVNRMPAFQRLGPNVYSVAGYSGHGIALAAFAGRLMAEAVQGTAARFDLFAHLPQPRFPGGGALRWPLLALAMTWHALRDRL